MQRCTVWRVMPKSVSLPGFRLHRRVLPMSSLVPPFCRQNICRTAYLLKTGVNFGGIGQYDTCPPIPIGGFSRIPEPLWATPEAGSFFYIRTRRLVAVCCRSVSCLRCASQNTANKWQIIWRFSPPLGSASKRRKRRSKMRRWVPCCEPPSIRYEPEKWSNFCHRRDSCGEAKLSFTALYSSLAVPLFTFLFKNALCLGLWTFSK